MGTPPASFTVMARLPNAVFTLVDCVPDPLIEIDAGTWTTVAVSKLDTAEPREVWLRSPPPYASTVFVTVTGEVAGTFTVSAMVGKPDPPLMAWVELQVT